jgi:uncharacterized membrane protein YidH (DUF202 family)
MGPVSGPAPSDPPERDFADPTRRTYLALERTVLAWWRTGFAGIAVALAVGRLLPEVAKLPRGPFLALGVGYGILAIAFIVVASVRQRSNMRALQDGGFSPLATRLVIGLTVYMVVLGAATIGALFWGL